MCQVMKNPPLPAELNAARLLNQKHFSYFLCMILRYSVSHYHFKLW